MRDPKQGRPPIEGQTMSKAEYQRRYRAKKALAEGTKEAYFSVSGESLAILDELVEFFGLESRNQLLNELVNGKAKEGRELMNGYSLRVPPDDPTQIKAALWEAYQSNTIPQPALGVKP